MKKFLAAMLSTTILCSAMAACGNQSTTPDTDDTAQSRQLVHFHQCKGYDCCCY